MQIKPNKTNKDITSTNKLIEFRVQCTACLQSQTAAQQLCFEKKKGYVMRKKNYFELSD